MATILIVDDLSANRQFLVTLLRFHGHRPIEAANGREALAAVRTERPDLVITDVLMPILDGYELIRQLRLDPATSAIPVVFYTAHYGEREARALALASGVACVLAKPAESAEVMKVVDRLLAGESKGETAAGAPPLTPEFDREHLRLVTDKLSEKAGDLRVANTRLRALINIGLEFASERDSDRQLHHVCASARDLFAATYVTLGIIDPTDGTLQRLLTCGLESSDWIKKGDAVSGIFGTLIAERRALRGTNPGGDPATLQLPQFHPDVHAYLAVPIASPAHVYGWICLVGNDGRTFTADDEDLVGALAGQIGHIYELEREILERQQAERALRQERDGAQRYLDTADVILLSLDLEGRITLINRKGCDLLERTEDELLGRGWIDVCLPPRIRQAQTARFQQLLDGDLSIVENPILSASGKERLIEWRNTLMRDETGRVIGTFSSGADITDRNQAVEALRTGEERMRFALEAADVGIWDLDFATGVLQWSETIEAQYGLQPGTFAGTFEAFIESIHPDDRAGVLETVERATKSGADFSVQYRAIWPDGTVRWLSGGGRMLLGEHGEAVRGIGISQDVTERHRLQEQYQQAQKMEAVGQLAGGVAHDFNNLLTVMLGYCELLLTDLGADDPRQADIIEIQRAGASAAGLTRQLLAFSRKEIIEPTVLDLNVVVGDMRAMLGRLIREDVKIVMHRGTEPAAIKADRGQVEQIIVNLAVNARDAMPRGGTLTIEATTVELDENYSTTHLSVQPGPYVVLTMSDTGTGMTPGVQARMFEPFFTTKELGRGTGLGLATVYGIAMRSGGSINVYSELGMGTSFKVYFPRVAAAEMAVRASSPSPRPRANGQTVLVVEDSAALRELARRLLQREGYTVLVAANADEALRLAEQHASIDVLLTDVVMPGASGPALTKRLVAQRPALKVIYMSGYTKDAIVHHGVLNPGISFLHKPFTAETLGLKLHEALTAVPS